MSSDPSKPVNIATYEDPEKAATEPTEAMTTAAENFIFLELLVEMIATTAVLDLCANEGKR